MLPLCSLLESPLEDEAPPSLSEAICNEHIHVSVRRSGLVPQVLPSLEEETGYWERDWKAKKLMLTLPADFHSCSPNVHNLYMSVFSEFNFYGGLVKTKLFMQVPL